MPELAWDAVAIMAIMAIGAGLAWALSMNPANAAIYSGAGAAIPVLRRRFR